MKHWLNNLEIAKSDNWVLAEKYDISAAACKYCQVYICDMNCPLTLAGYNCLDPTSPYSLVARLFTARMNAVEPETTQEDIVGAIKYMIKCLKEVGYE